MVEATFGIRRRSDHHTSLGVEPCRQEAPACIARRDSNCPPQSPKRRVCVDLLYCRCCKSSHSLGWLCVCAPIDVYTHKIMCMCARMQSCGRDETEERSSGLFARGVKRSASTPTYTHSTAHRHRSRKGAPPPLPSQRTNVDLQKDTQYQHLCPPVERQHFALDVLVKTCRTRNDTADRKTITHGRHFTN